MTYAVVDNYSPLNQVHKMLIQIILRADQEQIDMAAYSILAQKS